MKRKILFLLPAMVLLMAIGVNAAVNRMDSSYGQSQVYGNMLYAMDSKVYDKPMVDYTPMYLEGMYNRYVGHDMRFDSDEYAQGHARHYGVDYYDPYEYLVYDRNLHDFDQYRVKEFDLTAVTYKFMETGLGSPELIVNAGDLVRIKLDNNEGYHDFNVKGYPYASTRRIEQGHYTYVEFVADKSGTFEYYCSVGGHRQLGMNGFLIVQ